jgi:hypothetical protein
VLAAEQALEIHVMQRLVDHGQQLLGLAGRLGVALGGELEVELGLVERLLLLAPGGERPAQRGAFAQDALRRGAVGPEIRRRRLRVELLDARLALRQVKGTSRTPPGVLPTQCIGRSIRSARSS